MKATVHTEFKTLLPGDKVNTTIKVGAELEGDLAQVAVDNGFATPEGAQRAPQRQDTRRPKRTEGEGV